MDAMTTALSGLIGDTENMTTPEDRPLIPHNQIWMVVVGFLVAMVLAFGIGANDVANSFGTSVGAKVLTLRQAYILATIFETLGAVLIGYKVSDTIRKGIVDIQPYVNNTQLLMLGNVATLTGSCVWMVAATILRMPVSATHSIVGATVGFALVASGVKGINWGKMGLIVASWFISPVLAGAISTGIFFICRYFILSKSDPLEPGLRFLPIFYAGTIMINVFSVFYEGPSVLKFDQIPLWGTFVISIVCGIITGAIVRLLVVPWQRKRIKRQCAEPQIESSVIYTGTSTPGSCSSTQKILPSMPRKAQLEKVTEENEHDHLTQTKNGVNHLDKKASEENGLKDHLLTGGTTPLTSLPEHHTMEDLSAVSLKLNEDLEAPKTNGVAKNQSKEVNNTNSAKRDDEEVNELEDGTGRKLIKDRPETAKLFSFLQILTAVFGGFAHGGNDVSNAIGPLISLWLVGTTQVVSKESQTPMWILLFGGVSISLGLWVWGFRVIKTMGEDLTQITPSSGFCIEIGSAFTVLVASNIGIPISTTHCKVGSVVCVGRFRSRDNVNWHVFRNIVLAWLVTVPVTGGISAGIIALLRLVALPQGGDA